MQESIVFLVRVQCRRQESSRSLSNLLMSFLLNRLTIVARYYTVSEIQLSTGPKSLHLVTTFAFNRPPPTVGFPGTISVIFSWKSGDGYDTKWRRNNTEHFNWLSRMVATAHERYRRQTDGRVATWENILNANVSYVR